MVTITFFELEPFEKKFFQQQLPKHTLQFCSSPLTKKNASRYKNSDYVVVFVMSKIDVSCFNSLPSLKGILTMSTGYDHIDVVEAKKRKIPVCTVPQYGSNTVAEFAFSLLLSMQRKIVPAVERTRKGTFEFKGLIGQDVLGKTLGVLGTGKIGQHMITYAKAFGMNVVAYDKFPNKTLAKQMGFSYVTLNTLYAKSDVITLHLPLLESTTHILDKTAFSKMKKGVNIINTGRGPLIETDALIKALDKKIVGSVALDVLEGENDFKKETRLCFDNCTPLSNNQLKLLIKNHALLNRENVLITPHLAFYSEEAVQRILDTTLDNLKGFLRKKPINVVS